MPSLSDQSGRHVIIDKRDGHYLCFPDVALSGDGRLVVVYREADRHVASRDMLLCRTSADLGKTWSQAKILHALHGHCPRISRIADGALVIVDDGAGNKLYWSRDGGESFTLQPAAGIGGCLPDRIMDMGGQTFLVTTHQNRGSVPLSATRQPPFEQMVYISGNRGRDWQGWSLAAAFPGLALCEGSMTKLPDGRLLMILRENSLVYEPMYLVESRDNGATWSDPKPTPLIGHRPCLGVTPSGKLLITYRDLGPDGATSAWLGTLDELAGDFAVHGRAPSPENPTLTPEGLRIKNDSGKDACARYALRPITRPDKAKAELCVTLKVVDGEQDACGVRLGAWWRIFKDRIEPDLPGAAPVPIEPGAFHDLRFVSDRGKLALFVDGEKRFAGKTRADDAERRAIVIGNVSPQENNGGESVWRQASLAINEPGLGRKYRWSWEAADGPPDAWKRRRVLELKNARHASWGDFGYSGWTALPDGRFFCAYHHADAQEPGYKPGEHAYVMGTWFEEGDFGE